MTMTFAELKQNIMNRGEKASVSYSLGNLEKLYKGFMADAIKPLLVILLMPLNWIGLFSFHNSKSLHHRHLDNFLRPPPA